MPASAHRGRHAIARQTSAPDKTHGVKTRRRSRISGPIRDGASLAPSSGHDDLQSDYRSYDSRVGASRRCGRYLARRSCRGGPGRPPLQAAGTRPGALYRRPSRLPRVPGLSRRVAGLAPGQQGAASALFRSPRPICALCVGDRPARLMPDRRGAGHGSSTVGSCRDRYFPADGFRGLVAPLAPAHGRRRARARAV